MVQTWKTCIFTIAPLSRPTPDSRDDTTTWSPASMNSSVAISYRSNASIASRIVRAKPSWPLVCVGGGEAEGIRQLKFGIEDVQYPVDISTGEGGVAPPHKIHVLLRHRLLRQAHGFESLGWI